MRGFGFELPMKVDQHVVLVYVNDRWEDPTQVWNQCLWVEVHLEQVEQGDSSLEGPAGIVPT